MNSTPNPSAIPQQDDGALDYDAIHAAAKKMALARPDDPQVVSLIGQIAAAVRVVKEKSEELESTIHDYGPVLPSHGEDGLTYDQFITDLLGWQWMFSVMESTLLTHFYDECEEGYRNAGFYDDMDEEGKTKEEAQALAHAQEPADAPHVAELPRATSRPYWLSQEGQS